MFVLQCTFIFYDKLWVLRNQFQPFLSRINPTFVAVFIFGACSLNCVHQLSGLCVDGQYVHCGEPCVSSKCAFITRKAGIYSVFPVVKRVNMDVASLVPDGRSQLTFFAL